MCLYRQLPARHLRRQWKAQQASKAGGGSWVTACGVWGSGVRVTRLGPQGLSTLNIRTCGYARKEGDATWGSDTSLRAIRVMLIWRQCSSRWRKRQGVRFDWFTCTHLLSNCSVWLVHLTLDKSLNFAGMQNSSYVPNSEVGKWDLRGV